MKGAFSRVLDQTGAYMLQVLVALFLFSIAMLGLQALGLAAIRGNIVSRNLTEATVVAQQGVENIKSQDFDDIRRFKFEGFGSIPNYPNYRRMTVVLDGGKGLKRVIVRVVWWDKTYHKIELQTLIAR
jgi:Tfp pilus assembly protein PilV